MSEDTPPSLCLPSAYTAKILEALSPNGVWERVGIELHNQGLRLERDSLSSLLDTGFFASLTTEEGRRATFTLAIVPPVGRFHLAQPLRDRERLSVEALRKLSAACDGDATRLLIWWENGDWWIWGLAVNHPPLRREATILPGEAFLSLTARDAGVLRLRLQHHVVFTFAAGRGDVPPNDDWIAALITDLLPSPAPLSLALHHLSCAYSAMRAHGRGGALLIIHDVSPSQIQFRYAAPRSFPGEWVGGGLLHEGPLPMVAASEEQVRREQPQNDDPADDFSFQRLYHFMVERSDAVASMIGRLTAVDGIVVLNHAMCVLGFGGKIAVPGGFGETPITIMNAKDRTDYQSTVGEAFAGMRHKSAAVACNVSGAGAMALVQSQDGTLTVVVHRKEGGLLAVRPLDRLVPVLEE